jgi:hypothetical protein
MGTFFKKLSASVSKYLNFIFITVICILLVMLSLKQCSNNKLEKNVITLKDSTRQAFNKLNESYKWNESYVLTTKQLKSENIDLYNEIQKLKDHPLVISSIKDSIIYKDRYLNSNISSYFDKFHNKIYNVGWSLDTAYNQDNSFLLNGITSLKIDTNLKVISYSSVLNNLKISSKLYLSITDSPSDKKLHINVRSDFPNLEFSSIEGYIVDPDKNPLIKNYFPPKRWGIGPIAGIGLNSSFAPSMFIGVGIQYNFIRW